MVRLPRRPQRSGRPTAATAPGVFVHARANDQGGDWEGWRGWRGGRKPVATRPPARREGAVKRLLRCVEGAFVIVRRPTISSPEFGEATRRTTCTCTSPASTS